MGTHEYTDDPRNADVWISIDGELYRRPEAKVSVLDAGTQQKLADRATLVRVVP